MLELKLGKTFLTLLIKGYFRFRGVDNLLISMWSKMGESG